MFAVVVMLILLAALVALFLGRLAEVVKDRTGKGASDEEPKP